MTSAFILCCCGGLLLPIPFFCSWCSIIIICYHLYSGYLQLYTSNNTCCWGYNVAAFLWLQFIVRVIQLPTVNVMCFYISTFQSMCTVPNMAVFWSWLLLLLVPPPPNWVHVPFCLFLFMCLTLFCDILLAFRCILTYFLSPDNKLIF